MSRPRPLVVDRVALVLAAVLVLGGVGLVLGLPDPRAFTTPEAFASSFAQASRRSVRALFPLGVATSITTLLALLGHGAYFSARGRLQVLVVVALMASGFVTTSAIEPAAKAVVAAAAAGGDLAPPLAGFTRWSAVSLALSVLVFASLFVAARQPRPQASAAGVGGLDARRRTLLFLLGTATLFHGYDNFVVSMALPYIARDLGASESQLGFALSAIRVGALVSIVLGRFADRHGRRVILVASVLAYTIATAATGLSRGLVEFVVFQLVAMTFLVAELSLAQVVVAEEFPPDFRARGQGLLGAFDALGAGIAAMLFPLLQGTSLGWRGLYFVGIAPLLLVAWLRRSLPETSRWQEAKRLGETDRARVRELLSPELRLRFVVVLAIAVAEAAAAGPAFVFASYHATNAFGFEPAQVSAMILLGGGVGLAGWFVFGEAAERVGRRPVCALALAGGATAILGFYATAWLQASFALLVFMEAGARIAISSFGTELFPTRVRGAAKSWVTNAGILGVLVGLAIVGAAAGPLGGAARVITLLAILPLAIAPALLLLAETRGRELDETGSELGAAAGALAEAIGGTPRGAATST